MTQPPSLAVRLLRGAAALLLLFGVCSAIYVMPGSPIRDQGLGLSSVTTLGDYLYALHALGGGILGAATAFGLAQVLAALEEIGHSLANRDR